MSDYKQHQAEHAAELARIRAAAERANAEAARELACITDPAINDGPPLPERAAVPCPLCGALHRLPLDARAPRRAPRAIT